MNIKKNFGKPTGTCWIFQFFHFHCSDFDFFSDGF